MAKFKSARQRRAVMAKLVQGYDVKGWRRNKPYRWDYLGRRDFNLHDSSKVKQDAIEKLRKEFGTQYSDFNISNFGDVYW